MTELYRTVQETKWQPWVGDQEKKGDLNENVSPQAAILLNGPAKPEGQLTVLLQSKCPVVIPIITPLVFSMNGCLGFSSERINLFSFYNTREESHFLM